MSFINVLILLLANLLIRQNIYANESPLFQSCVTDLCGAANNVKNKTDKAWKDKTISEFLSDDKRLLTLEKLPFAPTLKKYLDLIDLYQKSITKLMEKYKGNSILSNIHERAQPPQDFRMSIRDYITYKALAAYHDVKSSADQCASVPKRLESIESLMFSRLKTKFSPKIVSEFESFYIQLPKRFGNCNRISIQKYIESMISELNTFFPSEQNMENQLEAIIVSKDYRRINSLIDFTTKATEKFAFEFMLANINAEFVYLKNPQFIYMGNYYLQPGFYFEETYLHEVGHAFHYVIKRLSTTNDLDSFDSAAFSQINSCLAKRHFPEDDRRFREDFADWFASFVGEKGKKNFSKQDYCQSFEVETLNSNSLFKLHSYDKVLAANELPYSSTIFRLLQLMVSRSNTTSLPESCQSYLKAVTNSTQQILACE